MPGTNARVASLKAQKQLLLAESEMQRALLLEDGRAVIDEIGSRIAGLRELAGAAASATGAVAALSTLWSRKAAETTGKPSWFQKLAGGIRLGMTVWSALAKRE